MALQASECSELLDHTKANCWIVALRWPGKFARPVRTPSCSTRSISLWVHSNDACANVEHGHAQACLAIACCALLRAKHVV